MANVGGTGADAGAGGGGLGAYAGADAGTGSRSRSRSRSGAVRPREHGSGAWLGRAFFGADWRNTEHEVDEVEKGW